MQCRVCWYRVIASRSCKGCAAASLLRLTNTKAGQLGCLGGGRGTPLTLSTEGDVTSTRIYHFEQLEGPKVSVHGRLRFDAPLYSLPERCSDPDVGAFHPSLGALKELSSPLVGGLSLRPKYLLVMARESYLLPQTQGSGPLLAGISDPNKVSGANIPCMPQGCDWVEVRL